jgi:predicted dehydrogenase
VTTTAVIGCGDISAVHLEAIAGLAGVELAGVCDTDPDRAGAVAKRYGVPAFTDHRDLLDAVRPRVAHVCTPHHQHVPVALDCLEAGVATVLEKPVAHTLEEADRLIAAARARPAVKIAICLQNRYNASSQAARALIAAAGPGAVRGGSATVLWHREAAYYQARPWRGRRRESGGGVLINQAIHTIDLLEWLLGDVTRVRGRAGRHVLTGIDVEDTAHAVFDHDGGARSVFFATTTNVVDSPVTIEVDTGAATLLIRGDLTITHADGRVETVAEPRPGGSGRSYWGASHERLIADFYRGLADPEPFWIGPEQGARSLRLVHEIYRQSI